MATHKLLDRVCVGQANEVQNEAGHLVGAAAEVFVADEEEPEEEKWPSEQL